jgi:hypothetical protein
MATPAQIAANQRNAANSTGPRTAEGKSRSAANATTFGLFTTNDFVLPEEQSEYQHFTANWHEELQPTGPSEEAFAIEIVRAAWRLRRCSAVEARLETILSDPMLDPTTAPIQTAVDRAHTRAHGILRRSITELRLLQTERQIRERLLNADDNPNLGLASTRQFLAAIAADDRAHMKRRRLEGLHTVEDIIDATLPPCAPQTPTQAPKPSENWLRSVPTARNAQCPCGSGVKHKRCCGKNAPPVLNHADCAA